MNDYTSESLALHNPEILPSKRECYVCSVIIKVLARDQLQTALSENEERQAATCASHGGLLSWCKGQFQELNRYYASEGLQATSLTRRISIGFSRKNGGMPKIELQDGGSNYGTLSFFLLPIPESGESVFHENSFDPDWVNLHSARRWLGDCVENHGSRCDNVLQGFSSTPAYLIDTEHDCIVEGETVLEYVALSYRWGKSDIGFRAKKYDFANLTVPGGISKQTNIPHTVKHAMHVVRSMGERYLWVDSLCIICDDRKHFQEQLQIMGSIYACAKLTIVSADGDAWDGLHGIKDVSHPRQLPNVFPWLGGTKLVVRDLPALSAVQSRYQPDSTSEYFQRGWTFQEYFLSRRRLIFGKRQIHWKCACSMFHEDKPNEKKISDDDSSLGIRLWRSVGMTNMLAGVPDFQELDLLAHEYHMREFTHPEDSLPGITGLLNLLKYSFKGGFLCGLPISRFDAALMWHCGLMDEDGTSTQTAGSFLEARKHSIKQTSDLPGSILPSWSWISWRSKDLTLDEEEIDQLPDEMHDVQYNFFERWYTTTPITTWYSQDTPFSEEKFRVCSFSDSKQNSFEAELLRHGWIKEPFDPVKHLRDGRHYLRNSQRGRGVLKAVAHKPVYSHPYFPKKFFWRPFYIPALGQRDKHAEPYELQQWQYISCRTWRNWFHARRMTRETYDGGPYEAHSRNILEVTMHAQIVVVDDSDKVCGWLQIPGEPNSYEFQDGSSELIQLGDSTPAFKDGDSANDNPVPRPKIELVAICCREKSTFYGRDEREKQFYGVLWIEWKNKVAYRRGCGFIEKSRWDESGAEEVDLVLG